MYTVVPICSASKVIHKGTYSILRLSVAPHLPNISSPLTAVHSVNFTANLHLTATSPLNHVTDSPYHHHQRRLVNDLRNHTIVNKAGTFSGYTMTGQPSDLLKFVDDSPTPFHVVANTEALLTTAGFVQVCS